MGLSPYDYDCMTYYDLILKIEGFTDNQKRDESIQRMIGFCAFIGSHVNPNKTKFDSVWPASSGESDNRAEELGDKKEAFKELIEKTQHVQ